MPPADRLPAIDVLKALCILTVISIHIVDVPGNAAEEYFLQLSRFAVPVFLAVSGWLHATREPITWRQTARRLQRILVPYLVESGRKRLRLHRERA